MIFSSAKPGRRFTNPFEDRYFNGLFNEFYTPLCRFSMKFVTNKDAAEDIVQDLFLYLWENRERLATISYIKSYVFTAVKNRSLNYLQKQYSQKTSDVDFDVKETRLNVNLPDSEELIKNKELESILEKGIESLPVKCRTIFTMKRYGDFSNKEVAKKLNISVKTVEAQMTIALRKITAFLSTHWGLIFLILIHRMESIL